MMESTATEALLRRDRLIVLAGLVGITVLAWVYLFLGAGMGMPLLEMSRFGLSPGLSTSAPMGEMAMPIAEDAKPMAEMDMPMGDMAMMMGMWTPGYAAIMIVMWWIMMMAMMVPSAAPMILLYARTTRHAQQKGRMEQGVVPTAAFAGGYLVAWLGFSLVATALQYALEQAGLLSSMMMWSLNSWLSAGLLIAAGLYQLSPLKHVCLKHCRSPVEFLSKSWKPGHGGAFRMGIGHGVYCVGCCWGLMALLFVGGIMNVLWIAGLAIFVLVEKLLPHGGWVARVGGAAAITAGLWIGIRAAGMA